MSFEPIDWLLTYLAHSTLILGAAWLVGRKISEHRLALHEALWRWALVAGLVTATLQLATGIEAAAGSWSLSPQTSATTVEALAPDRPGRAIADSAPSSARLATTTPTLDPSEGLPRPWRQWLTGIWALGAGFLLSLLAISYFRLRKRLTGRRKLVEGHLPEALRRLERTSSEESVELPEVRLTATSRIAVALARGVRRPEICLPEESLDQLPLERHEIVLAHELAHLRRRDPVWFTLTRILERLLFLQPLNGVARRRLQEIAEFRCDDWAVAVTRRPISLAKCLTEAAELHLEGKTPVPAPTLAAGRTHLGRRVARLLKRSYPMPVDKLPRWVAPAALVLIAVTILIAPGIRASSAPALVPDPPLAAPPAPPTPPEPEDAPSRVAPAPPAPESAPSPPAGVAKPPAPPAPAIAPAPPPAPEHEHAGGHLWGWDVDSRAELADSTDLAELASIAAELEAELAPMLADATAALAPSIRAAEQAMLAAEASSEWIEALELDGLEDLREMSARLERVGFATEAETARLAEMAERLIEAAEPSLERLEELEERASEILELEREALSRHRERAAELDEAHLEEIQRLRAETQEAFRESAAERRELIERSREAREQARIERERAQRDAVRGQRDAARGQRSELRAQRGELREEMLRMRHELLEQLRELDEELARDAAEGTADRADENKR